MSCLSFTGNPSNLSEKHSEATDNVSAKRLEERLQWVGHNTVLDIYYTFINFSLCRDERNGVEGNIAQLAFLDSLIATVVACRAKLERRGGHRKKMYADTYFSYVTAAFKQLVGRVGAFLEV